MTNGDDGAQRLVEFTSFLFAPLINLGSALLGTPSAAAIQQQATTNLQNPSSIPSVDDVKDYLSKNAPLIGIAGVMAVAFGLAARQRA